MSTVADSETHAHVGVIGMRVRAHAVDLGDRDLNDRDAQVYSSAAPSDRGRVTTKSKHLSVEPALLRADGVGLFRSSLP